jgi:hypothetical protein
LLGVHKGLPTGVALHIGVLVVIQAGSAHLFVLHGKAQWLDQMQAATGIGSQSDDVAGVGWNFGLNQNDMKHAGFL